MKIVRVLAFNAVALIVFGLLGGMILEVFCRTVVDDGGRFEFEMWRYAKELKVASPDPELPFVHRPRGRARIMGAEVAINARDSGTIARSRRARPSTRRIMMLGDSVTFDRRGATGDDGLAARGLLNANANGSRFEVLNAASGNYNTRWRWPRIVKTGRALEPDIVCSIFFVNDAEPTPVPRGNILTRAASPRLLQTTASQRGSLE